MDPFVQYLQKLKSNLPLKTTNVQVVIGNESCDLDSTVCSLTLAYFLQKFKNDTTILPLLNVLENEFPLRTENIYVLNKIGVKEENLIYKDTIDMDELKRDKNLEITLVDHHVLSKHYEFLKENVRVIFDHRPLDTNANWDKNVIIDRKIVGSCSSLIADEILRKNHSVLTRSMAEILYQTIIFDTIGLSEEAGKVKDLDIDICKKLENHLNVKLNPSKIFDELWAAHNDVSRLTPKQLLVKDLKIIDNIAIPGLPMLVKQYLNQYEILKTIRWFCKDKQCDYVILMGLEAKGMVVERDIAFFSMNPESKLFRDIIEKLMGFTDLELEEDCSNVEGVTYFRQNPKISRKQIVPQIQEVLKSNK